MVSYFPLSRERWESRERISILVTSFTSMQLLLTHHWPAIFELGIKRWCSFHEHLKFKTDIGRNLSSLVWDGNICLVYIYWINV